MTRHYETLFVVKPTLTEEEIKAQIDNVKSILEKNGAEIAATFDWGMRKLAYEIEKSPRGYYYVIYYTAPSSLIKELERNFRYNEEIIRFLNVKYENKKEINAWQNLVNKAGAASAKKEAAQTAGESA
ncbi:30S ribosomal protein S6 [Hydrogenimonas thermophila]|uniref:Small ribosomal subunit protein bS6 n=1 Tax=Hydrogenimonas thermophila TaxID=223786 RepID=A0A1I5MKN5_9BACT|nr:30S ribosomal protein S6 [Hydrogenimonas thermophila]WOE70936.1 30S ribosomal protein S6 [Hydrogenimonas thermophila]WOE73454.1 30S ribosomal protein S6 [Hydrogenimonas thermophila]SFP10073.1 SSU ribosomal protein S6P [Hydrogenimonas thermophila]